MDLRELEKITCLIFLYGFAAPVLGIFLKGRSNWQRAVMVVICFMIPSGIFKAQEWGLTLASQDQEIQFYRGHATGYHFYFVEAFALALVLARAMENWRDFRFFAPGVLLYLVHCTLCCISIVNAPNPSFAWMAALKAFKITLFLVLGYNFFSSQKNIHVFLIAMVIAVGIQFLASLRQRYLLGIYQVMGTFEHQNSLSMFVTMIGMVFLAVSLGPKTRGSNLYLLAYLACGMIEESTFSRAGMVIFAAGSAGVALLSILDKITWRRVLILSTQGLVGVTGLALSLDTIRARFNDYGNDASEMTRVLLNQAARNMVHDYPLGIGWNNYAMMINQPFPYGLIVDEWELEGGVTIDPNHQKGLVESLYYLFLAETGWQGLGSLLLFMAVFLWWNVRNGWFYRYHFYGALSAGIAVGCGCNYLQSILERILIQPRNQMLWFLLLGLTARIAVWRRQDRELRQQAELDAAEELDESEGELELVTGSDAQLEPDGDRAQD